MNKINHFFILHTKSLAFTTHLRKPSQPTKLINTSTALTNFSCAWLFSYRIQFNYIQNVMLSFPVYIAEKHIGFKSKRQMTYDSRSNFRPRFKKRRKKNSFVMLSLLLTVTPLIFNTHPILCHIFFFAVYVLKIVLKRYRIKKWNKKNLRYFLIWGKFTYKKAFWKQMLLAYRKCFST